MGFDKPNMLDRRCLVSPVAAVALCTLLSTSLSAVSALAEQDQSEGRAQAVAGERRPAALESPAVLAIAESNPRTAAESVRAIEILVDLDRPAMAKPFVQRLISAQLSPEAMLELADTASSATLIKLAAERQLGPDAVAFFDLVLSTAERVRRDPARLAQLASQLGARSEVTRAAAAKQLLRGRSAAVEPLVRLLADPRQSDIHPIARAVLQSIGGDAIGPLLGTLDGDDQAASDVAAESLGLLRTRQALVPLAARRLRITNDSKSRVIIDRAVQQIAGQVLSPADARRLVEQAAQGHLARSLRIAPTKQPDQAIWQWDPARREAYAVLYPASDVETEWAMRLARALHEHAPANSRYRRLYLVALLQLAKLRHGLSDALPIGPGNAHDAAASQGTAVIEDVLASAVAQGCIPAATAAAEVLGEIGTASLLESIAGEPRPLATAAAHADHRLRFAAVHAIAKLRPCKPFAGSSRFVEALGYFASSSGRRKAIIGFPRRQTSQNIAGLLAQLGYDADVAATGRDAFRLATMSPDCDFALLHVALEGPPIRDLIKQFRRDPRTARLPIGVLAIVNDESRASELADAAGRAMAMLPPSSSEAMRYYSEALLDLAGQDVITSDERARQAAIALDGMLQLAELPRDPFDLRSQAATVTRALSVPALSERAAMVLGRLATSNTQRHLIALSNSRTVPLATRRAAASAFQANVDRFGLLLTNDEVALQYDTYNASASQDRDTQAVLASILDSIESRTP